jgi:hypothetical protein
MSAVSGQLAVPKLSQQEMEEFLARADHLPFGLPG